MNDETTSRGKRLKQMDDVILATFVLLFLLIHSIYILFQEKKSLEGDESVKTSNLITQRIINKGISAIIIVLFFWFDYDNLKELQENDNTTKNENKLQLLRVFTSVLAIVIVVIEIYIQFEEYNNETIADLDDVIL